MMKHLNSLLPFCNYTLPYDLLSVSKSFFSCFVFNPFQILNDMTGNLDAKKACTGAMKLHKKYLKKVTFLSWTFVINLEFTFKIFLEVRKSET